MYRSEAVKISIWCTPWPAPRGSCERDSNLVFSSLCKLSLYSRCTFSIAWTLHVCTDTWRHLYQLHRSMCVHMDRVWTHPFWHWLHYTVHALLLDKMLQAKQLTCNISIQNDYLVRFETHSLQVVWNDTSWSWIHGYSILKMSDSPWQLPGEWSAKLVVFPTSVYRLDRTWQPQA